MFQFQINRQNRIWLVALSVLMTLVIISPNLAPPLQALLLGVFLLAMLGTFISPDARQKLIQAVSSRAPLVGDRGRMSAQAREATERAQARGDYRRDRLTLIDIGLIASHSGAEGMVMRRTRSVSKDDDGVRPFITLQVPPDEAERKANVRFAFIDQTGRQQYDYEMSVYLRDGELNVLADRHMPLMGNDHVAGMGDWDLRVYIDGALVGVHGFALTPSTDERQQRVRGGQHFVAESDADDVARRLSDSDPARRPDSVPMSLEDLLRGQNGSGGEQ